MSAPVPGWHEESVFCLITFLPALVKTTRPSECLPPVTHRLPERFSLNTGKLILLKQLFSNARFKICMMLMAKHLLALRNSRFAGYAELIAVTASGRWHLVLTFMAGTE